jgi:hypothetical protein
MLEALQAWMEHRRLYYHRIPGARILLVCTERWGKQAAEDLSFAGSPYQPILTKSTAGRADPQFESSADLCHRNERLYFSA